MFSKGGSLLPSFYADARCIDAGIVPKAPGASRNQAGSVPTPWSRHTVGQVAGQLQPVRTARVVVRKSPLATKNLLEVTDGLRRPTLEEEATQPIRALSMR